MRKASGAQRPRPIKIKGAGTPPPRIAGNAVPPAPPLIQSPAPRIAASRQPLGKDSTSGIRDYLYGSDDGSIEQGQMDTMDVLASRESWRMSELAEATLSSRSEDRICAASSITPRPARATIQASCW